MSMCVCVFVCVCVCVCVCVYVDIRCVCGNVASSSLPTTSGQNVPGLIRVGIDVSHISLSVSR